MTADVGSGVEHKFGFVPQFVCLPGKGTHKRLVDAVADVKNVSFDYDALNVFFRVGLFLNGATPFREIRRYSPPPVIVAPRSISREEAISAYIDLFRQAIRRRTPVDSILALSGGRDSRHILLELVSQRQLPRFVLTVDTKPEDLSLAKMLAQRFAIPHETIRPDPSRSAEDEAWKNIHCDFMAWEHRWFVNAGRNRGDLAWWDGIAGDVLSAGLFLEKWNLKLFEEDRLEELAEKLVEEPPAGLFWDETLLPREPAVAAVYAELLKHRTAANPVGSFYFWNRTRVTIGSCAFGLLRPQDQVTLAPFLDSDLWEFLSSLPARMLLDHQFHTDTLRRAYPDSADVPFASSAAARNVPALRKTTRSLLRYIIDKPELWTSTILGRLMRCMFVEKRAHHIHWLLGNVIYASQLQRLAKTVV